MRITAGLFIALLLSIVGGSEGDADVRYTLDVEFNSGTVEVLRVHAGEEVVDAVAAFEVTTQLSDEQRTRIVDHLCGLSGPPGGELLCTRRTPRKLLFDFSVLDNGSTHYIHVHDVGDTPASVAAAACAALSSCRTPSVKEQAISEEVERRLRLHYTQELGSECLYTRLGTGETFPRSRVSTSELRRAFFTRSKVYHPDKPGGDAAAFLRLKEAYSVLTSEEDRRVYDQVHGGVTSTQQQQQQQQQEQQGAAYVTGFQGRVEFDGLNVNIIF